MAVVARFNEKIPQKNPKRLDAGVVAYQPWLNGERALDLAAPTAVVVRASGRSSLPEAVVINR
jgi:hypothetical protein